jgi:hypothetical protein
MAQETRAGKYGRFLAVWIKYTIDQQAPGYQSKFITELKRYSIKPKKKEEPRNEGCTLELEGIYKLDIKNPKHLAKLVKEGIHLMYQKRTSAKTLSSLLENL